MPSAVLAEPAPFPMSHRARMAALGAVMLALILSSLDQTIVGTALPRITTDLHGSSSYTWVVTAYLLSSTVAVPVYGKLSDVYGRKPLLLVGISIFLVGSVLCGVAQSIDQLIAFRALQGLGAGALFPISLAVVGDLFSARERGRYQGLFGGAFAFSFLLGPFLGGALTDGPGWRWVFYVNLPVGLAALIVIGAVLPRLRNASARVRDLDYLGVLVFTAGVIPLLLGLTNKGTADAGGRLPDWLDPSVGGLLALGVVLLALFLVVEARAEQPIVPLSLFRNRTFSASLVATTCTAVALFATMIYLPRFFQVVRGDSATASGYQTWPLMVGLLGASALSGQLVSRTGRYRSMLLVSMVAMLSGMVLLSRMTPATSTSTLWIFMAVVGIGVGPAMSAFTTIVQNVAPRALIGSATSTLAFARQVGGSVGLAIAGTVFNQSFSTRLPGSLAAAGVPTDVASRIGGGELTGVGGARAIAASLPADRQGLVPHVVAGIHDAFTGGIAATYWVGIVAGALALAATFLVRELPLRGVLDITPEVTAQDDRVVSISEPARRAVA